ncbi:histidine phosphatase family protein [Actinomycetospora endophytica]|uniref:Histidine phosphatase family protein n=1 Tax=Actinomycetospora endophytica TaxID=2291215 RepID=A0ABS8PJA1_9PSEU|nr:histidine phosphatase family protein [Actinomycetospora endophytica]MCD2197486.1 histidine phosphatase family protein [Actinomycetospora endophytica]
MSESPVGRIFLLRHGETEWSANGKHTGLTDIPLTPRGEEQARTAGRLLTTLRGTDIAPPVVWCSPRRRARDTAALAGLEPDAIREDLGEWDYGDYEGRTTPDIRTEDPGWTVWTHPVPHGETAPQIAQRIDGVIADADRELASRDVVLVGHGHAGRVLIARYLGLTPAAGVGFAFDPASVTVLGHERGSHRIDLLNAPGGLVEPPPPPADR